MAQFTEAVYTNGVLKPKQDLMPAALQRLMDGIEGMKFFSRERLPSRDELYDRPRYQRSHLRLRQSRS